MGRFTLRPADWLRVAMSGGVCSILSVCAAGVTSGRRGGACVACRLRGPEAAGTLHLIYSSGFSRRSAAPVTSPRLFTARLEGGSAGGRSLLREGYPPPPIRAGAPVHTPTPPSPLCTPPTPTRPSSSTPTPTICIPLSAPQPQPQPSSAPPYPPPHVSPTRPPPHPFPSPIPTPPPSHPYQMPYPTSSLSTYSFHHFPIRQMGSQPNPHPGLQPSPAPFPPETPSGPHPLPAPGPTFRKTSWSLLLDPLRFFHDRLLLPPPQPIM